MVRAVTIIAGAGAITLGLASAAWSAGPTPGFSSLTTYAVGAAPRHAAVGDLNGDGYQDIASADSTAGRVSVLLGKGDGTFNTSYSAATVSGARSVALADFTQDGKLDIVATQGTTMNAQVLINDGGVTPAFTSTVVAVSTTNGLRNVATADFNGDSWPDIAVAGFGAGKVGVRLNNKVGGFDTLAEYSTASGVTGLVAADVTGDAKADLISFNRNGSSATSTVSVLVNGGSGTFTVSSLGAGVGPDFGAVGDLTGDGKADFVAANTTSTAGLTVGLNNGSGVFSKGNTYALPTGSSIAEGASLADVNLDGRLDALVAVNTTGFALYLGNGDGTFEAGTLVSTGTSSLPYGLTTSDLNGDGKPDVVLTAANGSPANNVIGVVLNTTSSGPAAPTGLAATPGDASARITFTAPGDAGITNYEYSTDNGTTWSTPSPAVTASPLTITGLTNSTTYQVRIRAVNAAGSGTASAAVSVTPTGKPTAPVTVSADGGILSWSAPNWASAPTAYVVVYKKWSDRSNSAVPWGVYAARAKSGSAAFRPSFPVPLQVTLNATVGKCGATNQAAGWTYCPLPRGASSPAGGFAMRVYAMNGATPGAMSSITQVTS